MWLSLTLTFRLKKLDTLDIEEASPDEIRAIKRELEEDTQDYQGVRGIWGKRTNNRKSKMTNMRRWGKRGVSKVLRGMWGKRAAPEETTSYILCSMQPDVNMFFCKKYPDDDTNTDTLLLPEKKNYNSMLKGMWG